MVDISVTASAVLAGANASIERGLAGATITAGQCVYKDATSGKYLLSDADGAAALRVVRGISLNGASDGQPLSIITEGDLTMNAVLTANIPFFLSGANPGGICPIADVGSGEYAVLLGIASSTTVLKVKITATGVAN